MTGFEIVSAYPEMAEPLAELHKACFDPLPETPWSASAFRALLKVPGHQGLVALGPESAPMGFLLGRETGGDAEVLTVCVAPLCRRGGVARALLETFLAAIGPETRVVLEVAVENVAAIKLYQGMRFCAVGRRPEYYGSGGTTQDALIFARESTLP